MSKQKWEQLSVAHLGAVYAYSSLICALTSLPDQMDAWLSEAPGALSCMFSGNPLKSSSIRIGSAPCEHETFCTANNAVSM